MVRLSAISKTPSKPCIYKPVARVVRGEGKAPARGLPSLCGQTQATSGPCPSVEVEGASTSLQPVPSVLKKLKSSFLRPPCSYPHAISDTPWKPQAWMCPSSRVAVFPCRFRQTQLTSGGQLSGLQMWVRLCAPGVDSVAIASWSLSGPRQRELGPDKHTSIHHHPRL